MRHLVLLSLIVMLPLWSGCVKGTPSDANADANAKPAPVDMMATRICLSGLRTTEENLRVKLAGAPDTAPDTLRETIATVEKMSVEGVHPSVLALRLALTDNLQQGQEAMEVVDLLKKEGKDLLSRTVGEVTKVATSKAESEYAENVASSQEQRFGIKGERSTSVGVVGTVPMVKVDTSLQASADIRRLASNSKGEANRTGAESSVRETLSKTLERSPVANETVVKLADFRCRLIAWRRSVLVAARVFPEPPDNGRLLVEVRGHHARQQWPDAYSKASELLPRLQRGSQEHAEATVIKLNARYQTGQAATAHQELMVLLDSDKNFLSRELNTLRGFMLCSCSKWSDAANTFDDCCRPVGLPPSPGVQKLLAYHDAEAEIGKVAALLGQGRAVEGRKHLVELLQQRVSKEDQSLLWRLRWHASEGPLSALFKGVSDVIEIRIELPWVTKHWVTDDFGFSNGSSFALTNVEVTVWSEKGDGAAVVSETKVSDIVTLGPGEKSPIFSCRGLVTDEVKRVRCRIRCNQGECVAVLKEF